VRPSASGYFIDLHPFLPYVVGRIAAVVHSTWLAHNTGAAARGQVAGGLSNRSGRFEVGTCTKLVDFM
jgi:hypothetical protein